MEFFAAITISNIGSVALFFATILLALTTTILIWAAIFRQAGYSGWLSLLMFIPVFNLFTLIWFALATWPVTYASVASDPASGTEADIAWETKMLLRKAMGCERRGQYGQAMAHLEQFIAKTSDAGDIETARAQMQRIQEEMSRGGQSQ